MAEIIQVAHLQAHFKTVSMRPSSDWPAFNVHENELLICTQFLKTQFRYDLLVDITAVDWQAQSPRFSVVYHFYSTQDHTYLRLVCDCLSDKEPKMQSIVSIYAAANWHEREVYDMFGINFVGHPDLKRILMWDGYEYFPLRKEFPLAGIETDLPAEDVVRVTNAKLIAAPMMGGPFVAAEGRGMSQTEPSGKDQSWTENMEKPKTKDAISTKP